MSSQSTLIFPGLSPALQGVSLSSSTSHQPNFFARVWTCSCEDEKVDIGFRLRCNALSKPRAQECTQVLQNGLPAVINWPKTVDDDMEGVALKVSVANEIKELVDSIRLMLGSMDDGEISISAYDTAWVALVEDVHGSGAPQFPSSLRWIANHQLSDGSWGESSIFSAHDRIINTLACVIALKSWDIHPEKCKRGISFVRENLCKLEHENAEHMLIGFEVAFPSLLEMARSLGIEVPDDSPVLQEINAKRNIKLTRIPKDIMHIVPTTLLHSLEGMPGPDWEKLLRLQCPDGSFLFSPSSTAFALMQTKDENCLRYLKKAVEKFNGGVPNVYPVDLFEHMWAVDRLQRLGVSRYFQSEIKDCVDYVYRYWTEKGICWARNSCVQDIDDTAMGFRLLRSHGHHVSTEVFRQFEKEGEFVCFAGQSTEAVTGMYNLYRASQVMFPGEGILEEAKKFSAKFLREKQACNQLLDKWIIAKDLPGEVGYALDVPWYASLPRVETRFYIEQYGGEDDIWIGKTLYRMHFVNNNIYLDLAKMDYNDCQALHHLEWDSIQKWYTECSLGDFGISSRTLLLAYFIAAASIFEPERSKERLSWTKTAVLMKTIASYFDKEGTSSGQRSAFIQEFKNNTSTTPPPQRGLGLNKTGQRLLATLFGTLNQLSLDIALMARDRDIRLYHAWEKWMQTLHEEEGEDNNKGEAELLVYAINLSSGRWVSEEQLLSHPRYQHLSQLANKLCHQLIQFQKHKEHDNGSSYSTSSNNMTTFQIELDMQELVHLVLQNSQDDLDADIKQTFLTVAKSFYYTAYFNPGTINSHIAKVLFERVEYIDPCIC